MKLQHTFEFYLVWLEKHIPQSIIGMQYGDLWNFNIIDFNHIFFYVLLTVHPNMTVFFYQLDAQILYFNTFIAFLYMFRALLCSSSGGQL